MAKTHHDDFFHCNNCGGEVSTKAKMCPHCGADDDTAWKNGKDAYLVETDDDFDYDEFVAREVHGRTTKSGPKWWVIALAVLLLGLIALRWIL